MLPASFFAWWYGPGWKQAAARSRHRLARTTEFFSFALLARSLFAPYKQISAGAVRGNIAIQFRAFIDRTVSRFVGFFVRLTVLFAGTVSLLGQGVVFLCWLMLWPLVPLLPLVMLVLSLGVF